MTAEPRVTVLLAVYNGGDYLREAVESVLTQTFSDFELLLVDDCSTDGTVASLPDDVRIRVLRNETNLGQIPSLNRGLREARGTYVARLDHDDVCLPRRLELQVQLLDRLPGVALTGAWTDIVDTSGRLWTHVRPEIGSFAEFAAQVITGRVQLVHPSVMFRRDVVTELGGFDESLNAAEDHDLYRKLVLARKDARVVSETLLHYRRHEQQMTIASSAAVWESDGRSYDRFLAALAPDVPASVIRLMLRRHPDFWAAQPVAREQLDQLLDGAASKLRLDPDERRVVGRALARRGLLTLLSGWTGDTETEGFSSRAQGLTGFIAEEGGALDRVVAIARPLLTVTAPAAARVGAARDGLTRVMRSDTFKALRRVARTSRALRRLYARVADTRVRD